MADLYKDTVFVSSTEYVPQGEHYALIRNSTTDDGYGGRSPCVTYTAYLTKEAAVAAISGSSERYRLLHVRPLKVKLVVEVEPESTPFRPESIP